MPYVILPVNGGFKVFNRLTGKSYSTNPLTKRMASLQKKAIEYHECMGRRDLLLNSF